MAMTQGQLMRYVRERFPTDVGRNCSVAIRLIKKFGLDEAEAMIRGAKAYGLDNLIGLNAKAGELRRSCEAKFWHEINTRKNKKGPMKLGEILRRAMRDET